MEQSLTKCLISAGMKHSQVNESLNDGSHTERSLLESVLQTRVQMDPLLTL